MLQQRIGEQNFFIAGEHKAIGLAGLVNRCVARVAGKVNKNERAKESDFDSKLSNHKFTILNWLIVIGADP